MRWRATRDAELDLDALTTYGARQFGILRALDYYDELVAVFGSLAENPRMAAERTVGRTHLRLLPHRSHNVIYSLDGDDVVILRVIHGSANWVALFSADKR